MITRAQVTVHDIAEAVSAMNDLAVDHVLLAQAGNFTVTEENWPKHGVLIDNRTLLLEGEGPGLLYHTVSRGRCRSAAPCRECAGGRPASPARLESCQPRDHHRRPHSRARAVHVAAPLCTWRPHNIQPNSAQHGTVPHNAANIAHADPHHVPTHTHARTQPPYPLSY